MKRQTTEKKIAEFLDYVANSRSVPTYVVTVKPALKGDVRLLIMAVRQVTEYPSPYSDGRDAALGLSLSLRSLIQKRYPARPKRKTKIVRRMK